MSGASISVFEFDSVVRDNQAYKTVWTPYIDETLQVIQEDMNDYIVLHGQTLSAQALIVKEECWYCWAGVYMHCIACIVSVLYVLYCIGGRPGV